VDVDALRKEKVELEARHGPWTAHNVVLAPGLESGLLVVARVNMNGWCESEIGIAASAVFEVQRVGSMGTLLEGRLAIVTGLGLPFVCPVKKRPIAIGLSSEFVDAVIPLRVGDALGCVAEQERSVGQDQLVLRLLRAEPHGVAGAPRVEHGPVVEGRGAVAAADQNPRMEVGTGRQLIVGEDVGDLVLPSPGQEHLEIERSWRRREFGCGGRPPARLKRELEIDGGIERCIRILVHAYTERDARALRHVYLYEARQLRTDLPE
jgi:hypothetical protein